jgi:hypothetical protein
MHDGEPPRGSARHSEGRIVIQSDADRASKHAGLDMWSTRIDPRVRHGNLAVNGLATGSHKSRREQKRVNRPRGREESQNRLGP